MGSAVDALLACFLHCSMMILAFFKAVRESLRLAFTPGLGVKGRVAVVAPRAGGLDEPATTPNVVASPKTPRPKISAARDTR